MSNFDSSLKQLVSQYAAEDFAAQRKRLREARMKWIEENECPTDYAVKTTDADGKEVTFNTPFQIGKRRYDQDDAGNPVEWSEEMKKPVVHEDPAAEAELLDGIGAILTEANAESKDKRLTILVAGDQQQTFLTGGDAEKSPHPPILEGEDYGEYYARVARAYERQTGTSSGRPVPDHDGVRESTAADSPGVRGAFTPGNATSGAPGPMLDRDADAMRPGYKREPPSSEARGADSTTDADADTHDAGRTDS